MRNYEQSYANLGENEENEERSIKLHSIGRKILGHTTTSQDEETTERGEKNIPTPDDLKVMEQFDLSYEELDRIRGLKILCETQFDDEGPYEDSDENKHIKEIWNADSGWEKIWGEEVGRLRSKQKEMGLDEWLRLRQENPYIFWGGPKLHNLPKHQAIDRQIREELDGLYDRFYSLFCDKVNPIDVAIIDHERRNPDKNGVFLNKNWQEADEMEVVLIANYLGVQMPITIVYSDPEEEDENEYDCCFMPECELEDGTIVNVIEICRYSNAQTGEYDTRDQEKEESLGQIIAHEVFHAWQYEQTLKDPPTTRGEQYIINHDNYIDYSLNKFAYESQLVEREAYVIGFAFEDAMEKLRETDEYKKYLADLDRGEL